MEKNTREKIKQNLADCDCKKAVIEEFLKKYDAGEKKEALRLLESHQKELLDRFHKCNDCIGSLDYLVAQMKRGEKEE